MMQPAKGINKLSQQRLNRALVIDLLRRENISTRAKLAKLTRLKRATITNIINEFIACGLVVETGVLIGQDNRRSVGIRINGNRFRIIGVMLAKTHYHILLAGLSGEPYLIRRMPIGADKEPPEIIEDIKNEIRKVIDESKDHEVLAIGFAMYGFYERKHKKILYVASPVNWDGIPIHEELQKSFSIPVFIENDANAGAFAQMWYRGNEAGFGNLVYILAGEGIGCGIISDNEILLGEIGLAGEIGHSIISFDGVPCECGSRGCLEAYCSTIALEKKLRECIQNGEKTVLEPEFVWEDAVRAIREGDELALREYITACKCLSVGIINIINLLNPRVIMIGDSLAETLPELMLETIREGVRKSVRPIIQKEVRIEINSMEINPVLLGASAIAAQEIFKDPYRYISSKKQ